MSHFILRSAAGAMAVFGSVASSGFEYTAIPELPVGAREIYVSNSGSDLDDGLTQETAKATPWVSGAGGSTLLRQGYGDRMYLERGSVWTTNSIEDYVDVHGGLSAIGPTIVRDYGSSSNPRPKIKKTQVRMGYGGSGLNHHMWLIGIHLDADRTTAASLYDWGLDVQQTIAGTTTDILVEDCKIDKYVGNCRIQHVNFDVDRLSDVRVRACVFADAFPVDDAGHSQGIYCEDISQLVIESSVFDHNGWHATIPNCGMTIFNHNVYVNGNCTDVTFYGNWSSRSSLNGTPAGKTRVMEKNLLMFNPHNGVVRNYDALTSFKYNVVIDSADVRGVNMDGGVGAELDGYGLEIQYDAANSVNNVVEVFENIFTQMRASANPYCYCILILGNPITNLRVRRNVVYNWPSCLYPGDAAVFAGSNDATDNAFILAADTSEASPKLFYWYPPGDFSHFTLTSNRWYAYAAQPWWYLNDTGVSGSAAWIGASGETGGLYTAPSYSAPERDEATMAVALGKGSNFTSLVTAARGLERPGPLATWTPQLTIDGINHMRDGLDMDPVTL